MLQPFLQDVVNEVGGSSSVTVLDDVDIVYIAHASLNRAIRLTAGVGSRYPVYPTSMGRVLLAFQPSRRSTRTSSGVVFASSPNTPKRTRRAAAHCQGGPRQGLCRDPGRARLRHRVGLAANLRSTRADRRGGQLLRRHEPFGSGHDDQEAAAGTSSGRASHRRDAHAAPRADELGGVASRPTTCAREASLASASQSRPGRAPRRAWGPVVKNGPGCSLNPAVRGWSCARPGPR